MPPLTNGRLPKKVVTERIIEETLRRIRLEQATPGGGSGGTGGTGDTTLTGPFVPTRILAGTTFTVPANMQCCAAFPIVVEPGATFDLIGSFAFVN
jgi:hypothetical protein